MGAELCNERSRRADDKREIGIAETVTAISSPECSVTRKYTVWVPVAMMTVVALVDESM